MTDEPRSQEPESTADGGEPPPGTGGRRMARPALPILALVFIAVLLVFAIISVANDRLGPTPSPSSSPAASASAGTPSAAASPSGAARESIGTGVGASWRTVASFPGFALSDVATGGAGWVAVGWAGPAACDACPGLEAYTASAWMSEDGLEWERSSIPEPESATLSDVAAGPAGLIAIGTREVDGTGVPQTLASEDGSEWTPVDATALSAPGVSVADLLGGDRYVAVGSVGAPGEPSQAAIWTSTDGVTWLEAHRSIEEGAVHQVVAGGPGYVAVGEFFRSAEVEGREGIPVPAYWISSDGLTWTAHDFPLGTNAGGGAANAVVANDVGLVAVGYAEYPPPDPPGPVNGFAAWQSADGISWQPAPVTDDFLEDIGGGWLTYAAADRVFAIGSGCRCGTGWPGRWWTAPDGLAWTEHQETPPNLLAVIPYGNGLLGVGFTAEGGVVLVSE